jgi:putative ABC transport system substrate-binding protein
MQFDQLKRRELVAVLGGLAAAWPLAAHAQQPNRMRKIGLLMPLGQSDPEAQRRIAVFTKALREMGWTEGQTITFEKRYADAKPERLPALVAELVQANVDVIVTQSSEAIDGARKATSTIPIVMASVGDAVGAGYVTSLARPGGNVTGLTLVATEQSAKRLGLIKEVSPGLVHVAVLWNGNAAGHRLQLKEMEEAAPVLDIVLQSFPVRNADEINESLRAAMQANAHAIVTMDDPLIQSQRARIVELALRQRLPVMGEFKPIAAVGALMSYGPSHVDMWRRAASYVDKTFNGARPADLPVEQSTKFDLVINLKTAKTLGLTIPSGVLAIADEVIE